MKKLTNRNKPSFEDRLPFILAFVIPILIMLGIFAGKELYPFGKNCFLRTDLYHQYVAFFEDLANRLRDGKSLTYSFDIGLGSNYTALFAYYLSGPLHFLAFLIPTGHIIEFVTGLILLKIGMCGWSMAFFLSKKFRTRHMGIAFCGICYALSGYLAAYSWNIMWLDVLWLTPVVLWGLERLIEEDRPLLYCLSLAFAILCNYYISIMLCIFLVLYFISRLISHNGWTFSRFLGVCFKFGLYSALAGGLAAVLLIPCFYSLQITASAGSTFPKTVSNYFSVFEMLSRHLMVVETETGLDHWPNLYCGVGIFLFLPLYYMNRDVDFKEKIVNTVLLGILLLSFNTNMLNFIWHGLHYPNSLPCRQSFLYNFVMLTMCFEGILGIPKYTKSKVVGTMWGGIGVMLLIEVIADSKEIPYYAVYSSIAVLALYGLNVYLYKTRRLSRLGAIGMAICVLVVEMGVNTAVTSVSYVNRDSFTRYDDSYDKLIAMAEAESPYTRIERYAQRTKNDGPYFGFRSASLFSSTTNASVSQLYKKLGMEGNTNAYSYTGSTLLASAMFSVGYRLTEKELPESPMYSLVGTETDHAGGKNYLYRFTYTLPLGYLVPDDTAKLWKIDSGTPAKIQNSFVNIAASVGNILDTCSAKTSDKTLSYTVDKAGWYYAYMNSSSITKVNASSGGSTRSWSNLNRGFFVDLGWCEEGGSISVTVTDDAKMNGTLYRLNSDNFIKAIEKLSEHPFEISEITDTLQKTEIRGSVTADASASMVLSIPFENGWTCTLDGKEVQIGKLGDCLMTIDVTEGTHEIVLHYEPEGLHLGTQISLICLCILLLILVLKMMIRAIKANRQAALEEKAQDNQADKSRDRLYRIHQKDSGLYEQEAKRSGAASPKDKPDPKENAPAEQPAEAAETSDGPVSSEKQDAAEKDISVALTPETETVLTDAPQTDENGSEDKEL